MTAGYYLNCILQRWWPSSHWIWPGVGVIARPLYQKLSRLFARLQYQLGGGRSFLPAVQHRTAGLRDHPRTAIGFTA